MSVAGVLRIELRHYDLESHALDRYATPQYGQDAVINFCLFIKKSNKMAEFYVIFAACVFISGTGGLESNQHFLG